MTSVDLSPDPQTSTQGENSEKDLADHLAHQMMSYIKAQSTSSDVLRTDITRRDKMLQELKESKSPNVIQELLDPHCFVDVDDMLRKYDEELAREPETFEDHFTRSHYAFSAATLFSEHKIAPLLRQKEFGRFYNESLARYQAEFLNVSPPPAPPQASSAETQRIISSSAMEKITEAEARALLDDPRTLMKHTFILPPESDDPGLWSVKCVSLQNDMQAEYGVVFADCGDDVLPPMDGEELVRLMMDSCLEV